MSRKPTAAAQRRALREESKKPVVCSGSFVESQPMTLATLNKMEDPKTKAASFGQARSWRQKNWFVSAILELKGRYALSGLTLTSGDPKKEKQFQKWLKGKPEDATDKTVESTTKKSMWMRRYVQNGVDEYLINDNLISMWLKADDIESDFPAILLPEKCQYSDSIGVEQLKYDFNIKNEADKKKLAEAGVEKKRIERYSKGMIELEEKEGEFYFVTAHGLAGQGLTWPRLFSVFRTLTQNESMEVGESLLAYAGRLVIRMHRKGFEPKNAASALKYKDFMWTEEWAASVKKFFSPGKLGFAEATGNFDHTIELVWTDPKFYEGKKWETIVNRLIWWAGPLGYMLMNKTVNPNWMTMFEAEIKTLRDEITPHLEFVLNSFYGDAPGGIKISFSDTCFREARLLWDIRKTMMMQGPGSLTSNLHFAGLDPETEAANRKREAKDLEVFGGPLFDQAHGPPDEGGSGSGPSNKKDKGGRRGGSRDGDRT